MSDEKVEAAETVETVETETELAVLRVLIARQLVMAAVLHHQHQCLSEEVLMVLLGGVNPAFSRVDDDGSLCRVSDASDKAPLHRLIEAMISRPGYEGVSFQLEDPKDLPGLDQNAVQMIAVLHEQAAMGRPSLWWVARLLGLVQR